VIATYVHPAALPPEELLKSCEIAFGRNRGPGGQHRNKVETAVTITHKPTGIDGFASERRKQYENRLNAIKRLRLNLAVHVRVPVHYAKHRASELWQRRRQGEKMSINPNNKDYPGLLAEALDVIVARRFDVAGSAGLLGITMSQLAKLIRHEKHAMAMVNEGRRDRHLPELK
jgi:hypothetical protein